MGKNCYKSLGIAHEGCWHLPLRQNWSPHTVGCIDISYARSSPKDATKEASGKKKEGFVAVL